MKRLIQPVLSLLGLGGSASKPQVLSTEEFMAVFIRELKRGHPGMSIEEKGDLELSVNLEERQPFTIFLNNAYDLHKLAPENLAGVIKAYVDSAHETLNQSSEQLHASQILPVVKDTQWLEEMHQMMRERSDKAPPDYLREALAPGLEVFYAQDTPKNIRYLTEADFVSAGIELAGLRQLACANFRQLMPAPQHHDGDYYGMVTLDGNYESSLLLFGDIWEQMKTKVRGDLVIGLPTRDVLLFTGSDNAPGLEKVREAVQRVYEGSYRLTKQLYVFREGAFELFSED